MFNYPNNSFLHVLRIVALRISKILSANNSFLFILKIIIYLKLYNSLTNLFIILNILIDMNYKILTTEEFEKDFKKLDNSIKQQIIKEIEQLKINPLAGKSLNYHFFREKKIQNYRIYYLLFNEKIIILLVAISSKKNQQKTINKIKLLLPIYKKYIENRLNKDKL